MQIMTILDFTEMVIVAFELFLYITTSSYTFTPVRKTISSIVYDHNNQILFNRPCYC